MGDDGWRWQEWPEAYGIVEKKCEEIPLPVEIWSMILAHKPMTIEVFRSLSMCSKTMREIMYGSGWIWLTAPDRWPDRLLTRLVEPSSLRISGSLSRESSEMFYSISKAIENLKQIPQWGQLFSLKMPSPQPHSTPISDQTQLYGGEEENQDDLDFAMLANMQIDDQESSSEEDHEVFQLAEDVESNASDQEQAEPEENAQKVIKFCTSAPETRFRIRNGGIYGEFLRLSDHWQSGGLQECLELCLQFQDAVSTLIAPLAIPSMLYELELHLATIPVEILPRTLRIARLPAAQFTHNLALFPRDLKYLSIAYVTSVEGCPPSLTKLKWLGTLRWETRAPVKEFPRFLPPSLTALSLTPTFQLKDLCYIPRHIKHLRLDLIQQGENEDLFLLPRGLLHLKLPTYMQSKDISSKCIKYLPSSLQCLRLPPSLQLTDQDVAKLPRTLTKFDFAGKGLTRSAYHLLPEGVKANSDFLPTVFQEEHALVILKRYPPDFLPWHWPDYLSRHLPVESCVILPRTMRRLIVEGKNWEGPSLSDLPPGLELLIMEKTSSLTAEDAARLPSTLLELNMPHAVLESLAMQALPNSLTILSIPNAIPSPQVPMSQYLGKLPPSLVYFCFGGVMDEESLKLLPPGLVTLDLIYAQIADAWVAHLPRKLEFLFLRNSLYLSDAAILHLPPNLRGLSLDNNNTITDAGILDLPKCLETLLMPGNAKLTDECVLALPRTLTQVDFSRNPNFTFLSLPDWPEYMVDRFVEFKEIEPPKEDPQPATQEEASVLDTQSLPNDNDAVVGAVPRRPPLA